MERCGIYYRLYNLKNMKKTHGGVLILVKLQASARNFTKINTPPWMFFMFFKLYKWYQIGERTTNMDKATFSYYNRSNCRGRLGRFIEILLLLKISFVFLSVL